MKTYPILIGTVFATFAVAPMQPAHTKEPARAAAKSDPYNRRFQYFLPKTAVGVTITQQITGCPVGPVEDIDIPVKTMIAIDSWTSVDPKPFWVDARAGFLSKRSTKLAQRADGTLVSFNVASEGQGGEVISSVIKVASTVLGWSAPAAILAPARGILVSGQVKQNPRVPTTPKRKFQCRDEINKDLQRLATVKADIADLEAKMIDGHSTAAELELLARRRSEAETLIESLSLSAGDGVGFFPAAFADGAPRILPKFEKVANAPAYEKWLEVCDFKVCGKGKAGKPFRGKPFREATAADIAGRKKKPSGAMGFRVALTVDPKMFELLSGFPEPTLPADRFVFYRRPVPARVSVKPCATPANIGTLCDPDDTAPAELQASKAVAIPQLSGLYSLSIGSGGLFGKREAKVELDANGAPTALEYGSGDGGANIAKVLDSGLTGATTLRDASTAATQRRIDAIKAQKELDELLSKDSAQ